VIRSFAVGTIVCLGLAQISQAQDGRGATAFGQLKSLAGDWEGTYEWTGIGAGGSMTATYSLSGNGSAVVETLTMDGVPSMTSVYHLDGTDLRMTHFCAAQNQPRLQAHRIDPADGAIDFAFVDATNLRSADAAHVHGLEMRFIDPGHITLTFLVQSGGQGSRERIVLERVAGKS
jgi:hypothetical protein